MSCPQDLARRLRNVAARELVSALERDGFTYRRSDGRRTVVHYHRSNDTLTLGTLRSILSGTQWTENDLERLGLN